MRKFLFLFLIALLPSVVMAQKAEITFKSLIHDYGKIKERDGAAMCTFTFTNTGTSPLLVTGVTASCGCTTPDWTKSPVLPGKSGYVKASYNPAGRPGQFDKTITVTTNDAKNSSVILRIKGDVEAKVLTIDEQYPIVVGNLRLKSSNIQMGRIPNTGNKTENLEVYNAGTTPIVIGFSDVPDYIRLTANPVSLAAKQKGSIQCVYNGLRKKDLGPVSDQVKIKVGSTNSILVIQANIEEDFSKYTPEQLRNAPQLQVKEPNYQFGTLSTKAKHKGSFEISNTGKTDLVIRKVATNCLCLKYLGGHNVLIKPGQKTNLDFELTADSNLGDQNYVITLMSNSPTQAQYFLYFSGNIK